MTVRLPAPAVVVLVGPSGAGKSAWAAANFRAEQIVASDDLRAVVGESRHDQRAGTDAFAVLDLVVERRLARRLTTVIDTTGHDDARRRTYIAMARRHGLPCHAVVFDTPADVCRARNRARAQPVPANVLSAQLKAHETSRAEIAADGFDGVHAPGRVELVAPEMLATADLVAHQAAEPRALRFGLQLSSFTWAGGAPALREHLPAIAAAAEDAGFTSLWVMDHFVQIPQAGREWEDMLESYTTLGYLAAATRTVRLGTLVTGVTYRNIAHLAKIVATLDVLSGGRAVCGIGAAWVEREHRAYGWTFPPVGDRYALLEDALELLPLMWGPGTPAFRGRAVEVPEAICYPRPVQEHIPILVGGGGERRTLALVARYADACNLFGDAAAVRHKLDVLAQHCARGERDPSTVEVTHLSTALCATDRPALDAVIDRLCPRGTTADTYRARVNAGTVDDHIGRYRGLADAGVQTAIVNLPAADDPERVARFGDVIAAFTPR